MLVVQLPEIGVQTGPPSGLVPPPPSGLPPGTWQMPASEHEPEQQSAFVEHPAPRDTQAAAQLKPPSALGAQIRLQHWSGVAQLVPLGRQNVPPSVPVLLPHVPPSHVPWQRRMPDWLTVQV